MAGPAKDTQISQVISFLMANIEKICLIAILLFGLASIKTIFREGLISAQDHPLHIVDSYFTALYMLPEFDFLGWDPYNNFGWVFNQHYGAGTNILTSSIYYLFLGEIEVFTCYKMAFGLTYLLMAPSIYLFVYSLSSDKAAGLIAALGSIVVFPSESPLFDAGLRQMYETGMWPERFGIVLCFLGIALLLFSFKEKGLLKTLLTAAWVCVILTWAVLTDLMAGIALIVMATIAWLLFFSADVKSTMLSDNIEGLSSRITSFAKENWRKTLAYLFAGSLSLALSAFWTIPFFQTLNDYHILPAVSVDARTNMLGEVYGSLPWYVLAFYALSIVTPLFDRERRKNPVSIVSLASILLLQVVALTNLNDKFLAARLAALTLFSLVYFLTTEDLAVTFPLILTSVFLLLSTGPGAYNVEMLFVELDLSSILSFLSYFDYSKFVAIARLLVIAISAIGVSRLGNLLYVRSRDQGSKKGLSRFIYPIILGLTVFLFLNLQISSQMENTDLNYPWSQRIVFKLSSDFPLVEKADELISWLRQNASADAYTLVEDTLDLGEGVNFPVSHYLYIAPIFTGKPIIGAVVTTNYITNPIANTGSGQMLSMSIHNIANELGTFNRLLGELGIEYVVAFNGELITSLNSSSEFSLSYYNGLFAAFKRSEKAEIATIYGNAEVLVTNLSLSAMAFRTSGVSENSSLYIRAVNYPGWSAEVNGKATPIETYYPKIPSVINWNGKMLLDYRVPFMKIPLPPGDSMVILQYRTSTLGDTITQTGLILLLTVNGLFIGACIRNLITKIMRSAKQK